MFGRNQHAAEPVTDETISLRAYQLWEARGCPETDGTDDWQAAKEQLLAESQLPPRQQSLGRPLRRLLARLRNRAA